MSVLSSRKFWITLITLIAVVLSGFGLSIGDKLDANSDALAGAVVLLATYVIALALDPGQGWAGMLKSRKFWALAVGLCVMVLDIFNIALPFNLTLEQIVSVCVAAGGYIVAVAVEGKIQPAR